MTDPLTLLITVELVILKSVLIKARGNANQTETLIKKLPSPTFIH